MIPERKPGLVRRVLAHVVGSVAVRTDGCEVVACGVTSATVVMSTEAEALCGADTGR